MGRSSAWVCPTLDVLYRCSGRSTVPRVRPEWDSESVLIELGPELLTSFVGQHQPRRLGTDAPRSTHFIPDQHRRCFTKVLQAASVAPSLVIHANSRMSNRIGGANRGASMMPAFRGFWRGAPHSRGEPAANPKATGPEGGPPIWSTMSPDSLACR